jgi:hypothetical protein
VRFSVEETPGSCTNAKDTPGTEQTENDYEDTITRHEYEHEHAYEYEARRYDYDVAVPGLRRNAR